MSDALKRTFDMPNAPAYLQRLAILDQLLREMGLVEREAAMAYMSAYWKAPAHD